MSGEKTTSEILRFKGRTIQRLTDPPSATGGNNSVLTSTSTSKHFLIDSLKVGFTKAHQHTGKSISCEFWSRSQKRHLTKTITISCIEASPNSISGGSISYDISSKQKKYWQLTCNNLRKHKISHIGTNPATFRGIPFTMF